MGTIQIRNVPTELHRKLKLRAAENGVSLSDYLLAGIEQIALPAPDELKERLRTRPPLRIPEGETPAEIIRRTRDAEG
jgi:hypothetical protein